MKGKVNNLIVRYEAELHKAENSFVESYERPVVYERIDCLKEFIAELKKLRG